MILNVTGINSFGLPKPQNGSAGGVIIAGTIGSSSIIESLIRAEKLDVESIKGRWEAFSSQLVQSPLPGVESALVIVGSDRRGTIYGLYDISEQIGVSPWYFWADVPPKSCHTVNAMPTTKTQGSPTVKYRGFFINDNAPALSGWITAKFPGAGEPPIYGAEFHALVFELVLRLRANYLWPAGGDWTQVFFVDDERNQPLADEYAVVIGTSHTEPFQRATKEWSLFGSGPWQWTSNNASIATFMRDGAIRAKPYESIITMGMRGSGDTALSASIETEQLENIVDTQRQILADIYGGNQSLANIPQLWCLYKEVQGFYEAGMKVPDDVTLLWSDDNWGNIRRLPNEADQHRSGGAGVYFHFDYDGLPRNYKWHNTIQQQRTWEQMSMAYERNAREIWIANVGDIKPVEIPLTFFLDMAYDYSEWTGPDSGSTWERMWASKTFGDSYAINITYLLDRFGQLAGRRKFELVEPETYSVINYNEADIILQEWTDLAQLALAVNASLPSSYHAAFFELVLHPVLAGQAVHEVNVNSAKNLVYGIQGRNSANAYARNVLDSFEKDHNLTVQYHSLVSSKWDHMMDQAHIGYVQWNQPKRQLSPPVRYVQTLERSYAGDIGVSTEGTNASVPGDDPYHALFSNQLTILPADPYGRTRFIDLFHIGTGTTVWNISGPSYVNFTFENGVPGQQGSISPGDADVRIFLNINWAAAPSGSSSTVLNITSSTGYGQQQGPSNGLGPSLVLPINNTVVPSGFSGFVESDGYVAMEASHFSRIVGDTNNGSETAYMTIPWYGKTLSGVALRDPLARSYVNATTAPHLEYDFYSFTDATVIMPMNITMILGQGLNTDPTRPLKYAVAVDGSLRKVVQYVIDQTGGALPEGWDQTVSNAAWTSVSNTTIAPGKHTLMVWLLEPGMTLQKVVLDFGGVRQSYLGPPESKRV
ncbi:hypothetical protein B5807_07973 [Epicoccum nigrum]|uniref:Gylcosyl hydrolase 115 C-terminal domain-containing protein n=1 Tax=Epicoccum nigrum TaxID=105696 RepID=A0A1Y2LX47_EPING|nr:hypothetical protein B5807_07973 [Epicoccum nigrum]